MSRQPSNGYRNMSNGSTNASFTGPGMNSQQRLATPTQSLRPSSPGSSAAALSRAERFEDEKRRIIESCFSKLDANGQLAESYITHIRIEEDAQYPSSPPPPESAPQNKKPRLIIIAVRSTGRVRMHKARENNNGSFSIGKTWNLEEMSGIESYGDTGVPPRDEKERSFREWAGNVGFTVTITKPYYWQAGTSKEKDFFIASAVKIYRKYTKGQVPELKGFDERDKAMMLGLQPGQQAPAGSAASGVSPGRRAENRAEGRTESRTGSRDVSGDAPAPPQPPFAQREQSREGSRYRQSPGPPPSIHDPNRPGSSAQSRQQNESPAPSRFGPTHPPSGGPRPFASQEQMRAQSRDGYRQDYGRPGTAPAPPAHGIAQQQGLPPPSAPYSQSRSESPSVSSVTSVREETPKILQIRQPSPVRQRSYQQSVNSVPQERPVDAAPPSEVNGSSAGANLFAATRQRWIGQQQQPAARESQTGAPQLPPIETSQPFPTTSERTPVEHRQPMTAVSEASSAGIDMDDAAAIGALTSYWGPESTTATPPPQYPVIHEPSSPPTPERSRRRPQMGLRNQSEVSLDLRPPPLKQGSRTPDDGASQYGTPREDGSIAGSAVQTPRMEEPPEIRPLSVEKKRQSGQSEAGLVGDAGKLQMPGAFNAPPLGASPLATPVETPGEERGEDEVQPQTASQPREVEKEAEDDVQRPGLGPMFKKRAEVANRFKKAAAAANAFKPRPGGAAEKILRAKAEREAGGGSGEIDGVSGFVPRPGAASRQDSDRSVIVTPAGGAEAGKQDAGVLKEAVGLGVQGAGQEQSTVQTPKVEISSPVSPVRVVDSPAILDGRQHLPVELRDESPSREPEHLQTPEQQSQHDNEVDAEQALFEQREARKPLVKLKRRSNQQERNLAALGIDRSLLEGKGLDFEAILADFGWNNTALEPRKLADIEHDLRREQGRLEAGSWLSSTADGGYERGQREDKVQQVESLLDRAIQECDELEGLLTLYSVELGSLNEDIAFIEAQSQGLQVQSANQKLLHRELEGLVETMSLDRRVLEPLRYGDLGDVPAGLEQVEACVGRLYQAMVTIDPRLRGALAGRQAKMVEGVSEVSNMKALREKRGVYEQEATAFCQRLMQHLDQTFAVAMGDAKAVAMRPVSGGATATKRLNKDAFGEARRGLWVYGPLILFAKELNLPAWGTMMRMYYSKAQPLYADCFKENLAGWKRAARKDTGAEEAGLLFTAADRDEIGGGGGTGGLNAAARKLTVKRSQTLAKTLRGASGGNKNSGVEGRHPAPGQMMSSEAFAGAMDEMAPLISQEQNFVVELFHASSLETADFLEVVSQTPPEQRVGASLLAPKPVDPDREMAKRVTGVMDEVFGFFVQEMGALLEWSVAADPIQGVGVMACLSRHTFFLQESSQEFLLQLLETLTARLAGLWTKFVDEQVRAIEDTKVKIKKRKGVIGFVKVFPAFSAAVENVFAAVAGQEDYEGPAESMGEVRRLVDEAYARINRAMFDSLKVIAKEGPSQSAVPSQQAKAGGGDDADEKEMLNYHILIIENMNHYIEEVDDGGREGVLAEWRGRALMERIEALEGYVGRVMRRPLGKLLDFLDSTEALLVSHPTNPTAIASRPSYSRKAARNLLSQHEGKEIRRGIDTLRKRIEKHFGDADEEALAQKLVGFVCKECERNYERTLDRAERIIREVYPPTEGEKTVETEFSKADVQAGFRR
ncbi:hypothetical protein LTR85_001105 [Meristemomyces frigidus]|nr:hypothetical protein LTR85_001105 [Meristemomyces frigidus]